MSGMEQQQGSQAAGAAAGESAQTQEAAALVAARAVRRAPTRAPTTAAPVSGAGKGQRKKRAAMGAAAGEKPPARARQRPKRAATGAPAGKSRATARELDDDPLDDCGRGEAGEEGEEEEPLPDDKGARKMWWALRVVGLDGLGAERPFSADPFYGDGEVEAGAEWHGTDREEAEEKHVRKGAEETKLGSSRADLQHFDEYSHDVRAANEKLHCDNEKELQVLRTCTQYHVYCRWLGSRAGGWVVSAWGFCSPLMRAHVCPSILPSADMTYIAHYLRMVLRTCTHDIMYCTWSGSRVGGWLVVCMGVFSPLMRAHVCPSILPSADMTCTLLIISARVGWCARTHRAVAQGPTDVRGLRDAGAFAVRARTWNVLFWWGSVF